MPANRINESDEELVNELKTFALTLEASSGQSLAPQTSPVGSPSDAPEPDRRRTPLLLLAACLLVGILGIGALLVAQRDQAEPLETVDEPDEQDDAPDESPSESDSDDDALADLPTPLVVLRDADGVAIAELTVSADGDGVAPILAGVSDENAGYVRLAIDELITDPAVMRDLGWDGSTSELQWIVDNNLTLQTTLDSNLQNLAGEAVAQHLDPSLGYGAQVITVDPATGAVAAYYTAGVPTDAPLIRPGSAFKPIVLAEAFEQGFQPLDLIEGAGPCRFSNDASGQEYVVEGAPGTPPGSLADMTAFSNNCAFVRLGNAVGTANTVDMAGRLGLTDLPADADNYLSLPLGPVDLDLVELINIYATFANRGIGVEPHFVHSVSDADGQVLYQNPATSQPIIEPLTADQVNEALTAVIDYGTGGDADIEGHVVAGKTGTEESFTSAMFVGYTRHLVTGVWVGDPQQQRELRLASAGGTVFGGETPTWIWRDYMTPAHQGLELLSFEAPAEPENPPQRIVAPDETNP